MTKYADGFAFADSIIKPEFALEILNENLEFFAHIAKSDPDYLEFFVANLALNYVHFESRSEYIYDVTLEEKAYEFVESVNLGDRWIQTDVCSGHQFCGSPWDIWVKTPAQYIAVVQGFDLEWDERTICYHKDPKAIDEVIELLETNRIKYNMSAYDVSQIAGCVACLDVDDFDEDLAPRWVYDRLIDYINTRPE